MGNASPSDGGHDWAERTLCDDGSCTGVIGGDGLCRSCGRPAPFWGDERRRGQQAVEADADDDQRAPVDEGPALTDDDRALCADGGCIGVVGADGCCKVCGLRADRAAAVEIAPPRPASAGAGGDPDDRALCPDGSCIGLLDARGVCKECGRSIAEN